MREKLEIICPNCKKENAVNIKNDPHCRHCKEELTDKTYIKKPWIVIPITIAFLTGVAGTIGGEFYLMKEIPSTEKNIPNTTSFRYPINNEYLILNQCISEDQRPLERSHLEKKKEICICALEKTLKVYDFSAYTNNESSFLNAFEKNVDSCIAPSAAEEALPASAAWN